MDANSAALHWRPLAWRYVCNMKRTLIFIFLLFSLTGISRADSACERMLKFIELKNSASVAHLGNWCALVESVGEFRNRFISIHGKAAWETLSYYKKDPAKYGGVKVSTFDFNLNEVAEFGSILSSNNIPQDINEISINETYTYKRKNDKWFIINIISENELENNYIDIHDYLVGLKDANLALDQNKSPQTVMSIFHKTITTPMTNGIFN
jgi:hypothetical protein